MEQILEDEEKDLILEIGKIVFPGVEICWKKDKIEHNLVYLPNHGRYTTSRNGEVSRTTWEIFLFEFVAKSLPGRLAMELKSYQEGTSTNKELSSIYHISKTLGL